MAGNYGIWTIQLKKNNWDLDCCQKDRHSRTLLRRQNATKKTRTYHHCTPQYLKTQLWYIRTCRVPKPLVSSTKEASWWRTSWQVTQSKPLKSVQASSKKLQNRIKQGNNEFLMFTPRLAWIVPKFNTTSKRARTGGASYIDKNRIKGISVKRNSLGNSSISCTDCTYANKSDYSSFIEQKSWKKRNYTNILSRVYRCVLKHTGNARQLLN